MVVIGPLEAVEVITVYVFPKLTGTGKVNATVYNIKDNNVTSSSQTVVNVKNDNGTLKIDR